MLTCRKVYTDIAFAHRQHRHEGHCRFIHGHNWGFAFTFACRQTDKNGFVVDFGKLGFIRDWLMRNLDHACVFNQDDPLRESLLAAAPEAFKVYVMEDCSSEGLARHLFGIMDREIRSQTKERAFLAGVEVMEDGRNSAVYAPDAVSSSGADGGLAVSRQQR